MPAGATDAAAHPAWLTVRLGAGTGEELLDPGDGSGQLLYGPPLRVGLLRQALLAGSAPWILCARVGLILPEAWERRLVIAGGADPLVGAISPLTNAVPLLAPDLRVRADEAAAIDRRVYALGERRLHQLPRFWPDCVGFARAALEAIAESLAAAAPESTDWPWLCRTLNAAGFAVAVCDHLYVHDDRISPLTPRPPPDDAAALIEPVHPLAPLRHHLREARRQGLDCRGVLPPRPVQLHLVHSWGGGLGRWVNDYVEHDDRRQNLILRSIGVPGIYGQRLDLCARYDDSEPLRSWVLHDPIRDTALVHLQYAGILGALIAEFAIQGLLISSLIGHSLDALRTGLPTLHVLHDYYPFCPALNVWFDQPCQDCGPARLADCFARNPANNFFAPASAASWLPLRARYLALVHAGPLRLVAPTPSVIRHLRQLAPELDPGQFTLIPHGIAWAAADGPAVAPDRSVPEHPPLRLLLLGRLSHQKGLALLEALWPTLQRLGPRYLLGCGPAGRVFAGQPGVTMIEDYRLAELPDQLRAIAPDLALLLSVVPETFSYTLSELQAARIPVLATDLGGYRDRIEDGVTGFLAAPEPGALRARLLELAARRERLATVRRALRHRPIPGLPEMLAAYRALLPMDPYAPDCYLRAVGARPPPAPAAPDPLLSISPELTYLQALGGFVDYTRDKLLASPRLAGWLKRLLRRWFGPGVAKAGGGADEGLQ